MSTGMLFGFMFLLLFLGMPIAFAICIPAIVAMFMSGISPTLFVTTSFTGIDSFPLMAVPFFILAGKLMEMGGISLRLINLVNFFIGKVTGGLAIVSVVTCALFGAVSGSAVATSVSVGGIMLPSMGKEGYDKVFSTALLCIAGTIGALIPPSMTFIIYGTLTGTSIGDLFIAGIGPGVLLTVALAVTGYLISRKNGWKSSWAVERTPGNFWKVFKDSIAALLVPIIILGGIYSGIFTPTEAGAVSCLYAFICIKYILKTLDWAGLYKVVADSAQLTAVMIIIISFAAGFARYLSIENIPQQVSDYMISISNSKYAFLAIVTIFLLIIGCIMDTTPAMIVMAPIFAPIAAKFGVDPVHFGIIMSFGLLVGLSTPPVGASLYVMSSMTKINFLKIARAMVPFYIATLVSLILVLLVPQISLFILNILK